MSEYLLSEAVDLDKDDERRDAKIRVLSELVDHHIEEEEGEVFKVAKKVLDKEQVQEIASRIQELKNQRRTLWPGMERSRRKRSKKR